MQSKLTLRLDDKLIHEAKTYAAETEVSLSQLVADYFRLLMVGRTPPGKSGSPVTRSLRGALKGAQADRQTYRNHLEEKYR
jgi:hypothetical protein